MMLERLLIHHWEAKIVAILGSLFTANLTLAVFTTIVSIAEVLLRTRAEYLKDGRIRRDDLLQRLHEMASYAGFLLFCIGLAHAHPWFETWLEQAGFAIVLITAGKGFVENLPLGQRLWAALQGYLGKNDATRDLS